jgi:hypothetical protein
VKGIDLKETSIRDLMLYVAVGLAVVGFAVFYGVYSARTGGSGRLPLRWVSFFPTTALVFWLAVKPFRRYWRRLSFWLEVGALLVAHGVIFAILLTKIPEWPLLWFVPTSLAEVALILLILERVAGHGDYPN